MVDNIVFSLLFYFKEVFVIETMFSWNSNIPSDAKNFKGYKLEQNIFFILFRYTSKDFIKIS